MIRTNNKTSFSIDDEKDGIKFNLTVLNRSKLDTWNYYNLVIAIGIRIDIRNYFEYDLEVLELGLGIIKQGNKAALYSSDQLANDLPIKIASQSEISFLIEGHSIHKVLSSYSDAQAFLYATCKGDGNEMMYKSKLFQEDILEEKLEKAKEQDLANWSQNDFVKLNSEIKSTIVYS